MATPEFAIGDFESPEARRLRLSMELGEVVARRSDAQLEYDNLTKQLIAAGGPQKSEPLRHRREQLSQELAAVELELNNLLDNQKIAAANAEIHWASKKSVYRQVFGLPAPEPIPNFISTEFDDYEED